MQRGNADCMSLRPGFSLCIQRDSRILRDCSDFSCAKIEKFPGLKGPHLAVCSRIEDCLGCPKGSPVQKLTPSCSANLIQAARVVDPTYVPDTHCVQQYLYIIEERREGCNVSLYGKNEPIVDLLTKHMRNSTCGYTLSINFTTSVFKFSENFPKYPNEANIFFFSTV